VVVAGHLELIHDGRRALLLLDLFGDEPLEMRLGGEVAPVESELIELVDERRCSSARGPVRRGRRRSARRRWGGPEVLKLRDVPSTQPGAGNVLVRVAASGLNRADVSQIAGRYPAPEGWPQEIPGLKFAGVVEAAGENVERPRVGDRVMGLAGGGGLAELVRCPAAHVMPIPESLSFEEAAAIPEAFITAHDALFTRACATASRSASS